MPQVENGPVGFRTEKPERVAEVFRRNQVTRSLDAAVGEMIDTGKYLLPVDKLWFPSQILPPERYLAINAEASDLPPYLLVLTIGNGVTESGISTYQALVSRPEGLRDESGSDQGGHARWTRGWSAEEKRHDDGLATYRRLSDRVNQTAVDRTTHFLIGEGFDPRTFNDPYRLTVFAAIQEDVTDISHRRVGIAADGIGATYLAELSMRTSRDERRHRKFYQDLGGMLFNIDPNGMTSAFAEILKAGIVLPAAKMTIDGKSDPDKRTSQLFDDYDLVAEASGMLTLADFVDSIQRHYNVWNIGALELNEDGEGSRSRINRRIETLRRVGETKAERARMARESNVVLNIPWLRDPTLNLGDISQIAA